MATSDLKVTETRKVTKFLLRSLSSDCIEKITHLDLSNLNLRGICGLNYCVNLETVLLHQNKIDYVPDLGNCKRLWKVDLSNNQIKVLNGFQYTSALGVLNLAGNELTWTEVIKLRDVEIVSIFFGGNKGLKRDVHYRKHVIDCLPKLWFLDGLCITSKERQKVEEFFETSSRAKAPVRHKVQDSCFTPSSKAIIAYNAFEGGLQENLYKEFARDERHDLYLDWKRLYYLSGQLGDCVNLYSISPREKQDSFRWILNIDLFPTQKSFFSEKVLFVILVCTQVFELSSDLMKDILSAIFDQGNIDKIMELFKATTEMRFYFIFLLYAKFKLIKLDKTGQKEDTIFYNICGKALEHLSGMYSRRGFGVILLPMLQHSLACFFVLIVALLPNFEALLSHSKMVHLLQISTKDALIGLQLQYLRHQLKQHFGDQAYPTELISKYILERVNRTALKARTGCLCWFYRCILDKNSDLCKCSCQYCRLLTKGSSTRITGEHYKLPKDTVFDNTYHTFHDETYNITPRRPQVGDDVVLDVQSLGRILAVPDEQLVLVNVDFNAKNIGRIVPTNLSIFNNFCYVDKSSLSWDDNLNCWKCCRLNPTTGNVRGLSLNTTEGLDVRETVSSKVSIRALQPLQPSRKILISASRYRNSQHPFTSDKDNKTLRSTSVSDSPTPATNKLAIYIPSPLTEPPDPDQSTVEYRRNHSDGKQIKSVFTNGNNSLKLTKHSLMISPRNQENIKDLKLTYSSVSLNRNSRSRLSNWISF